MGAWSAEPREYRGERIGEREMEENVRGMGGDKMRGGELLFLRDSPNVLFDSWFLFSALGGYNHRGTG